MRRPVTILALTLILLAGLGACGQKGPLERPDDNTTARAKATAWKHV